MAKDNLKAESCVSINLNTNDIALSNGTLIKTLSKSINAKNMTMFLRDCKESKAGEF